VTVRAFATAVVEHDTGAALEAIDRATREGEDLLAFTRDVIELLRLTLVLKAARTPSPPTSRTPRATSCAASARAPSLDELLYVLRAFLEADAAMRESPHPRVELEIATVRSTRRPVPQALDDVLRRVDEAQREIRQQALATPSAPARRRRRISWRARSPRRPRRSAPARSGRPQRGAAEPGVARPRAAATRRPRPRSGRLRRRLHPRRQRPRRSRRRRLRIWRRRGSGSWKKS